MQQISTALATHMAGELTTLCSCWRAELEDGTVFGFTDHPDDLIIDGVTYAAATGFTPSSIVGTSTLAVDNMEMQSVLSSDGITEEDLNAGKWDYAEIFIFQVNYADLTMGPLRLARGRLGEVTSRRSDFTAELRGLTDAYTRMLGELYGPACRAQFGDARCGINLADHTVTGTVQGISADGRVISDSGRTENVDTAGKAISGVSQAKAAVVTSTAHGFRSGQMILISGVEGVSQQNLNGINGRNYIITVIDADHFSIPVDTRPLATNADDGPTSEALVYSPYVSGGTATPAGAVSYFGGGTMTMTSGANAGLSMEVGAYAPGAMTLRLSFPNPVEVGDTYMISRGCGKRFLEDCVGTYQNGDNFRGEPFLPGMDQIIIFGGQAPGQGGQ